MRILPSLLLLASLMAACTSTSKNTAQTPTEEVAQPPKKESPTTVPGEESCPDDVQARISSILQLTARIRGLDPPDTVTCMMVDRNGVKDFLTADFEAEWDADISHATEIYKRLGCVPKDMDMKSWLIELLTEQIGGFYNTRTKIVYLIKDSINDPSNDIVLSHELTHLLDDHYSSFDVIDNKMEGNNDAQMAFQALTEGSATGVMFDFMFEHESNGAKPNALASMLLKTMLPKLLGFASGLQGADSKYSQSPLLLRDGLIFPYVSGLTFRNAVIKARGAEAINELLKSPPESTEQILHPDRFLKFRDRPQDIELSLPPGWTAVHKYQLGMFEVGIFLESNSTATARSFAEGWDGDCCAIITAPTGERGLVWMTVWDYDDEAQRFETWLQKLYLPKHDGRCAVSREGKRIVLVQDLDQIEAESVAQFALKRSTVTPRPGDTLPPRNAWDKFMKWAVEKSKDGE